MLMTFSPLGSCLLLRSRRTANTTDSIAAVPDQSCQVLLLSATAAIFSNAPSGSGADGQPVQGPVLPPIKGGRPFRPGKPVGLLRMAIHSKLEKSVQVFAMVNSSRQDTLSATSPSQRRLEIVCFQCSLDPNERNVNCQTVNGV